MKKVLIVTLILILTAAFAVIGTVAYLTDTAEYTNVMTVGQVHIALREYERVDTETSNEDATVQKFNNDKLLLPATLAGGFNYSLDYTATPDPYVDWSKAPVNWTQGQSTSYTSPIWNPANINNEQDKMVFVENTGDLPAFVRLFFAFEAGAYLDLEQFNSKIHLNLNTVDWTWEWNPTIAEIDGTRYAIATATYNYPLPADGFTEISLSQIALDSTATNDDTYSFGKQYDVLVIGQGVQSDGFESTAADAALTKAFGEDVPFEGISFEQPQGVSLSSALHYLNGDDSNPITANVATVRFGFNKDHADVVANYEGTLTSDEQDAMVYTYYVPNETDNTKYDVYVLADSAIYTPKDSKNLFRGMTSLTNVDTANMDVSRTEIMNSMFFGCETLTTLDVTNWNLSNVTDTNCMFVCCYKLNGLDVSKWNVSKVTDMNSMFYDCQALTYLDVSNWNVSQSTTMRTVFYRCLKLNNLDVSSWNVSNVTDMTAMFFGCLALTSLDVDEWNVSNVTTFERFLSRIDGSNNMSIAEIDVSKWNTDSLTNMAYMFQGCDKLTSLDMSNWNVSGVTNADGVFEICEGLTTLNVSGWDVSNVETMNCIFRRCGKLTELDLSRWNTANLKITASMFREDPSLKTIYIGDGWDVSKVSISENMFSGCTNLKGAISYNAANANDVTYANTEMGYLTYKAAPTTNP